MKKLGLKSFLALSLLLLSMEAGAKKSEEAAQNVYVFAASLSFSDSVMYMTDIQEIKDAVVRDKYFLQSRGDYAEQFKQWLEKGGTPSQVSSLFFYDSRKKALKANAKVRRKAMKKRGCSIETVHEFVFSKI